jgi:hypothetical protein
MRQAAASQGWVGGGGNGIQNILSLPRSGAWQMETIPVVVHPAAGTAVSESVGSTATPSCRSFFFNLSDHVCGLIRSSSPRPLHMHVAGIPSPHGASPPPPAMRVFKHAPPQFHADHSPCPACGPLSLPLFTRLLSDSIPQATTCCSRLIPQAPHPLPPWAALFHPQRPLIPSTIPSPSATFDPPTSLLAPPLKRCLRFPFVPHGTISGLC